MKKSNFELSDLVCTSCGNVFTIPRSHSLNRKIGHIKDLWCYRCNCVTKHYEVHEYDKFICNNYINKDKNSIKKLILKRK